MSNTATQSTPAIERIHRELAKLDRAHGVMLEKLRANVKAQSALQDALIREERKALVGQVVPLCSGVRRNAKGATQLELQAVHRTRCVGRFVDGDMAGQVMSLPLSWLSVNDSDFITL